MTVDPYNDPRIAAAEARHSKRRRRAQILFDGVDSVFYVAILIGAIAVIVRFAQMVWPHIFEF